MDLHERYGYLSFDKIKSLPEAEKVGKGLIQCKHTSKEKTQVIALPPKLSSEIPQILGYYPHTPAASSVSFYQRSPKKETKRSQGYSECSNKEAALSTLKPNSGMSRW